MGIRQDAPETRDRRPRVYDLRSATTPSMAEAIVTGDDLAVSFRSSGAMSNLVLPDESVEIYFTSPPQKADAVTVELVEIPRWVPPNSGYKKDAVNTDRSLAKYRGSIQNGTFLLDPEQPADPLQPPRSNPELNSGLKMTADHPDLEVKFGGVVKKIPLPDTEDELHQYEIVLRTTGNVGGSSQSFQGTAVLYVRILMDALILPRTANVRPAVQRQLNLLEENEWFGEQWQAFAAARRELVRMPCDGQPADFEAAVAEAAFIAKDGGRVILFVGHGSTPGVHGANTSSFDTIPQTTGFSQHRWVMDSNVLKVPENADRVGGMWVKKPLSAWTDAEVNDRGAKYDSLGRVGEMLRLNHVGRFFIATCNLGHEPAFGFDLAKFLRITVEGYNDFLATRRVSGYSPHDRVQAFLESQPPPPGSENDPSHPTFHEFPSGARVFQP